MEDIQTYSVSLGFRTGPRFITTFDFTNTGVEADWGRFNTTLGRLKMNYSFTPYRFIEAFLQGQTTWIDLHGSPHLDTDATGVPPLSSSLW